MREHKQPRVSIVIPCFNQADSLLACVNACWFQTWENLEIIVVDGGSNDDTKSLLSSLPQRVAERSIAPVLCLAEGKDIQYKTCRVYHEDTHAHHPKRILTVLTNDRNIGRNATYAQGLRGATGDYCTYVVGDDLPHPHMIERLVHAMEQHSADVVYADFLVVNNAGEIQRLVRKPEYSFEACFAQWFHLGVCTLHKRALHQRFGLFLPQYNVANDYAWYQLMAQHGVLFAHVPEVLYSVRQHGHGPELHEESVELAMLARDFLHTGMPNLQPSDAQDCL